MQHNAIGERQLELCQGSSVSSVVPVYTCCVLGEQAVHPCSANTGRSEETCPLLSTTSAALRVRALLPVYDPIASWRIAVVILQEVHSKVCKVLCIQLLISSAARQA